MARIPRELIINEDEPGIYHCVQRCVRRAFLCGRDPVSGTNYEHRKEWIRSRLEFLAGQFAIDILEYSVLDNHLHVILRNRPDIARTWTDDEVARRWWNLFPARKDGDGPAEPRETDLAMLKSDSDALAEKRKRLSSISWLMRCLAERIARRANKEDGCTGRFWEGRYKCQELLDESAVLACSVYVDLNPLRAGLAESPEDSPFTSLHDRARADRVRGKRKKRLKGRNTYVESALGDDCWLSPLCADSRHEDSREDASQPVCRASNKGFLSMELEEYLELVKWTARHVGPDKDDRVPENVGSLLQRFQVSEDNWCETVSNFGRWFHRAAGRQQSLASKAAGHRRRWFAGISHSRRAFV